MGEIVVGAARRIAENDGRTLMHSTAGSVVITKSKEIFLAVFAPEMGVAIHNGILSHTND